MPVNCPKLKHLDISHSKLRTFDVGLTPNLETLSLKNCADFEELHVSVACSNLKILNLIKSRLRSLDHELIPNLESRRWEPKVNCYSATLHLAGESLDLCPLHPNSNRPKLRIRGDYEDYLPALVGNIVKLISFGQCAGIDFKKFSDIICSLQCLKKLILQFNIPDFHKDLGHLECLEELCLYSTKIKHLPDSICMLKHLKSLTLEDDSICMLKRLKSLNVKNRCCLGMLLEDIGQLESLETLALCGAMIKHLPDSICMLKHLKYLVLKLPEDIDRLECLEQLDIRDTGIGADLLESNMWKKKIEDVEDDK
ncbi:disease resistance protein (TIR-NBS-LRR class) [Artemisia annua]|uniref:Disease resistance protein (TIR-NBS-LRR class) n=1 Tax=Artemisia annua TaxID=35608 RepID=A0A2U1LD85_ARTAN|nr:disease resistance protein (TIR-NBS-LRR class) [Artemisia annua]